MEPKVVRIFISSPADVAEERQKAQQIIADLGRHYSGRLVLKPILWEELPLMADMSFQQGIEMILDDQGGIDIAVFILWSRLGSPLGKTLRRPDESEYRSGTEREWELMLEARAESAKHGSPENARPKILAYVRNDEAGFTQSLQGLAGDALEEAFRQRHLARQFVREQFHDAQSGTNVGAYTEFGEPLTFAGRLRLHLRGLLDNLLPQSDSRVWDREPYRGLEPFDVEHATIFCGREREVCELDERFRARAKAGCPFLLLVGASGSGKSSLARAGWLHYLLSENLDPEVRQWLPVVMTPAEAQGDLVGLLARGLSDVLPSLRDEEGLEPLVRALRQSPEQAWQLSIRRAIRQRDPEGRTRLALLVDQLEELFTDPSITRAEADCFLRAVGLLVRTGQVWCLATVRSDFYDQCLLTPALAELKGADGQMDLLPADAGALRRIITRPAFFAGLRFETAESGETLDERILADTVAHPEALPLLEYLLRELYEGRSADGQLTLNHYRSLGGVEGALGRRAETVFAQRPEAEQAALGELLNALVTIADGEQAVPVRRRASLAELPAGACRDLATALVNQRLLVSDRGGISVAHEALLRRWDRAVAWIAENREALRIRARVAQAAGRWHAEGQTDDFLLPPGKPLAEAVALWTTRPGTLLPDLQEYIRRSQERHLRAEQRKRRRLQVTAAVFGVLALLAVGTALLAISQRQAAKDLANRNSTLAAQEKTARLEESRQRIRLLRQQAMDSVRLGWTAYDDGDPDGGLLWFADADAALETAAGLARGDDREDAATIREIKREMRVNRLRLAGVLREFPLTDVYSNVRAASFSHDGRLAATGSEDGRIVVHDVREHKIVRDWRIQDLAGRQGADPPDDRSHPYAVRHVCFTRNDKKLLSVAGDGVQVWDLASGEGGLLPHKQCVRHATFIGDGETILAVTDFQLLWWNVAGRTVERTLEGPGHFLAISPDCRGLAFAANSEIHVLKADSGKTVAMLKMEDANVVYHSCFSGNALRLATCHGGTVVVWDVAHARRLATCDAAQLVPQSYPGRVRVVLSADGSRVAAWEPHRCILLQFDAATGKPVGSPLAIADFPRQVVYGPGSRLAIACGGLSGEGSMSLWDSTPDREHPLAPTWFHPRRCVDVCLDARGDRLLAIGDYGPSGEARVWNIENLGGPRHRLGSDLYAFMFSADDAYLVASGQTEPAVVWKTATGQAVPTPTVRTITYIVNKPVYETRVTTEVLINPRGDRVTEENPYTMHLGVSEVRSSILPLVSGFRVPKRYARGPNDAPSAPKWEQGRVNTLPGGYTLIADLGELYAATANTEVPSEVRVWEKPSGVFRTGPLRHSAPVIGALLNDESDLLLVHTADGAFRVWDVATSLPVSAKVQVRDVAAPVVLSATGRFVVVKKVAEGAPGASMVAYPEGGRVPASDEDSPGASAGVQYELWELSPEMEWTGKELYERVRRISGRAIGNSRSLAPKRRPVDFVRDFPAPAAPAPAPAAPLAAAPLPAAPAVPMAPLAPLPESGDSADTAPKSPMEQGRESLDIARKRAAQDPDSAERQRDLAVSLDTMGELLSRTGDREGALKHCREGVEIRRKLIERDQEDGRCQRELSSGLIRIGDLLLDAGNRRDALDHYRESVEITRRLAAKDPENAGWQHDLAMDLWTVSGALADADDDEGALKCGREGLDIMRRLMLENKDNDQWQLEWMAGLNMTGDLLAASGDREGALARYREGLDVMRRMVAKDASNLEWQCDLCWMALLAGEPVTALQAGRLATESPKNDSVVPWGNFAHALLVNGRFDEARAIYEKYKGAKLEDGRTWEAAVADDFATFRAVGHDHSDMAKIEKLLGIESKKEE